MRGAASVGPMLARVAGRSSASAARGAGSGAAARSAATQGASRQQLKVLKPHGRSARQAAAGNVKREAASSGLGAEVGVGRGVMNAFKERILPEVKDFAVVEGARWAGKKVSNFFSYILENNQQGEGASAAGSGTPQTDVGGGDESGVAPGSPQAGVVDGSGESGGGPGEFHIDTSTRSDNRTTVVNESTTIFTDGSGGGDGDGPPTPIVESPSGDGDGDGADGFYDRTRSSTALRFIQSMERLRASVDTLGDINRWALSRTEHLHRYDEEMALGFANLRVDRQFRDIQTAQSTGMTAKWLMDAQSDLEQELLPFQTAGQNLLQGILAGVTRLVTIVPAIGNEILEVLTFGFWPDDDDKKHKGGMPDSVVTELLKIATKNNRKFPPKNPGKGGP